MANSFSTAINGVTFDAGLRAHMQRVFGFMALGLVLTGLVSFSVATVPALTQLFVVSPLRFVAMFAPFAFILFLNIKLRTISPSTAQTLFWAFCATMGLSMAAIFLAYTQASITRVFFITAATFATMSLYGYSTGRSLANMGAFLMMGVFGIMIAVVVNIFLESSMLNWMVSVAGVIIFTGLTAYDTQRIKETYADSWSQEDKSKLAVMGALSLYLNFINMFQFLLNLMGDRR